MFVTEHTTVWHSQPEKELQKSFPLEIVETLMIDSKSGWKITLLYDPKGILKMVFMKDFGAENLGKEGTS